MATQVGKGHIYAFGSAALAEDTTQAWATMTASYVSPNMQSLRVTHSAEVDKIKGQDGAYNSLIGDGDMLECEFTVIPEGSTVANAKIAATLPQTLECFGITGLPIIAAGPFADALNTNNANQQPWVYEGGGSIQGGNAEKWQVTLPLKRYLGISNSTKIS